MPNYAPPARQAFVDALTDPAQQLANHAAAMRSSTPSLATGGSQIVSWGRVNELGEIASYEREGRTVYGSSGDFEVEHAGTGLYVVYWTKLGSHPPKREPKPTPHQVIHLALAGTTATSIRLDPFVNEAEGFTVQTLGGLKEGVFVANLLSNCGWHMHVMAAGLPPMPEPPV